MAWTKLQFIDTGKVFLTSKYMAGVEYRLLWGSAHTLSIVHDEEDLTWVEYHYCTHSQFDIETYMIIQEKPVLHVKGFSMASNTLKTFTKEFLLVLIQDHIQIISQNPSGVM